MIEGWDSGQPGKGQTWQQSRFHQFLRKLVQPVISHRRRPRHGDATRAI